jgi:hypothetical protein
MFKGLILVIKLYKGIKHLNRITTGGISPSQDMEGEVLLFIPPLHHYNDFQKKKLKKISKKKFQ